ncbi:hypothetical protein EHQ68_16330 [Leptospira congkakensis]|uniref:Uncharacterized protein n=1 Tax=Leptospira congkakensis TaxID=2484932 RepID=A0A4Z1AFB6_9LEPT|nr:hypothetical protein EHQ68_16330 [Leptospira congkakensis]TGL93602.1 hypothetical protein EHQ69_03700 [Leptospira congkakensis]TGL94992.1 hypothetical protein EHQ70_17095 [Leptospira congkakensis]
MRRNPCLYFKSIFFISTSIGRVSLLLVSFFSNFFLNLILIPKRGLDSIEKLMVVVLVLKTFHFG